MKKVIFNLMILLPISIFANSNVEISGKVMDMVDNPLFECHVYLTENYGVLTDEDGFFKLEVPEGYENEQLHISYVGFETYLMPLSEINSDFLEVRLIEDMVMLDEIVIYSAPPWNEFKQIVANLSLDYETRDEFYAVLFAELKKIELELSGNTKESGLNANNNAGMIPSWPAIFIMISILLAGAYMIKPITRFKKVPGSS